MFKSLEIKNFKSHENTKLDFSPGVNVILGRSQAGKTNILRSLLWLIHNRPGGAKFFSDFAGVKGTTQVELTLDDETKISLSKDIRINKKGEKTVAGTKYSIDKGTLGWDSFEGFGASVPDVITEKLNLSELNIQKQFDMPFLVLASAGEIAKTINRVTKLEKVDQWISNLTTNINAFNQEVKILEKEIEAKKIDVAKYKNIDKAEKCIYSVIQLTTKTKDLKERQANIRELVEQLDNTNETIDKTRKALVAEKFIDKITELDRSISKSIELENDLSDLVDLENEISVGKPIIEKSSSKIKSIDRLVAEINDYKITKVKIKTFLDSDVKVELISEDYKEAKDDYIDLLTEIGKCPLCWNKIDKQCIEAIEKEL